MLIVFPLELSARGDKQPGQDSCHREGIPVLPRHHARHLHGTY